MYTVLHWIRAVLWLRPQHRQVQGEKLISNQDSASSYTSRVVRTKVRQCRAEERELLCAMEGPPGLIICHVPEE